MFFKRIFSYTRFLFIELGEAEGDDSSTGAILAEEESWPEEAEALPAEPGQ
ncbi:hypothetical protein J2S74_005332 [Evansella vedderi]|uniref:Uncharacterized protein n=1 Tax=Evansella vedderi TaxID=38282 RepID=A0ABU0A304_9BACI|nr:hypothetical protein [Evansella vedderi]MDQ0257869.1 hypothetical protein [Evansella vedderi]